MKRLTSVFSIVTLAIMFCGGSSFAAKKVHQRLGKDRSSGKHQRLVARGKGMQHTGQLTTLAKVLEEGVAVRDNALMQDYTRGTGLAYIAGLDKAMDTHFGNFRFSDGRPLIDPKNPGASTWTRLTAEAPDTPVLRIH